MEDCLSKTAAPETIDDAYCDSCTLKLTTNYYISEEERLLRTASTKTEADLLFGPKGRNNSGTVEEEAIETKPTMAKKRRAREARAIIRKLEDIKRQGTIGEVVGEGKAKARELGLGNVKWVKGQGRSLRMTTIARVSFYSCQRNTGRPLLTLSILEQPPRILALHLNRSGFTPYGHLVKKTSQIDFPPILDMSSFVTGGTLSMKATETISPDSSSKASPTRGQDQEAIPVLYRLDGVICHYGYTHSFGHFVAYRRKPDHLQGPDLAAERVLHPRGRWLRISDADVTEVPESSVLAEKGNAFILFYERLSASEETTMQEAAQKMTDNGGKAAASVLQALGQTDTGAPSDTTKSTDDLE